MAKKQKIEIKEKSVDALQNDITEAQKELFSFMQDNHMRKLKNTRSIFLKRKEIARILTTIQMKNFAEKKKEVTNG